MREEGERRRGEEKRRGEEERGKRNGIRAELLNQFWRGVFIWHSISTKFRVNIFLRG